MGYYTENSSENTDIITKAAAESEFDDVGSNYCWQHRFLARGVKWSQDLFYDGTVLSVDVVEAKRLSS